MAETPLVSVVVPTYNRVALLAQTVRSVLDQSLRDLELIVVDNMSSDGTAEYLAGVGDPRLIWLRNDNKGVIAVNRNIGIRHARGSYIAFCDDDDLWMPHKLERQVALMQERPEVGMCYTNWCSFREGEADSAPMLRGERLTGSFGRFLWGNPVPNSSVMVRKALLDEVGALDESPELVTVEDYELWLRLAYRARVACIDEVLLRYRRAAPGAGRRLAPFPLKGIHALRSARRKLGFNVLLLAGPVVAFYLRHVALRLAGK